MNTTAQCLRQSESPVMTAAPHGLVDTLHAGGMARMTRMLIANLGGMVYRCHPDAPWRMEFISDGCMWLTGYSATSLLDASDGYAALINHDDRARAAAMIAIALAKHERFDVEYRVTHADGSLRWAWERGGGVFDAHGRLMMIEGFVQDITARKLNEARIEQQANFDTLTGLANRSLLSDRLAQAIMTAATYGTRLGVVFVDLDRFKSINDTLGHHAGDQLLCEMARRLKACVRDCDTVARLGGDEFVLLLNGLSETDNVAATMGRMLALVSQPWDSGSGPCEVTCSVGVALYPDDGADAQTLLRHADSAMYRAKERGRNNFQFFTAELNRLMAERLELESNLRRAVEREQLCLYYQPRIDLKSGAICGAEALLHWRADDGEIVLPDKFMAVAEDTGLIVPIGTWALKTACQQNQLWRNAGLPPLRVSVNVSLRQFQRSDFPQTIATLLKQTALAADGLEIEVTESTIMHNAARLINVLHEIKAQGVQISIDDFGTGYSSLRDLRKFPVDRLKIDRSFVKDLQHEQDGAIVRTIITLGHNLGLKVVAEGVETIEQMMYLRDSHCDELQGFYYGHPLPAAEFEQLLRDNVARHKAA